MKSKSRSAMRLVHLPSLTKAESAALARQIAAARSRNGGPTSDQDIPDEIPEGARIIHGPARCGRPSQVLP